MVSWLCLLEGYLFGCFLPAVLVARARTGQDVSALGTGNPGTANITRQLGPGWGALVLLGDVGKTAAACILARAVSKEPLAILWAGLGAALGHICPFWRGFRGGKGVAVTCTFLILFSPFWGTVACLAGLLVTRLTGWLALGAVVIPLAFLPFAFLFSGPEAGVLTLLVLLLMFLRHFQALRRIGRGEEKRSSLGKR